MVEGRFQGIDSVEKRREKGVRLVILFDFLVLKDNIFWKRSLRLL